MSNRPFLISCLLLVALVALPAAAQGPPQQGDPNTPPGFPPAPPLVGPAVQLELLSPVERIAPGAVFPLAVRVKMAPTWHINVPNPPQGDGYFGGAYATTITVDSPAGFSFGAHQWPEAHDVIMARGTPAQQKILCIEGNENIYIPVRVPDDAPAGLVEFVVSVDYQTCDYQKCLPPKTETINVTVEIDPSAPEVSWDGQGRFAAYDAEAATFANDAGATEASGHPFSANASVEQSASAPGSDFVATLTITLQKDWHVWGPEPVRIESLDFETWPTSIRATLDGTNLLVGKSAWPEPKQFTFLGETVPGYEGTFDVRVPVRLPDDLPDGDTTIEFAIEHQVCDSGQCLDPQDAIATLPVTVDSSVPPSTLSGFDAPADADNENNQTDDESGASINIDELGIGFSINTTGFFGMLLVLVLAALAGFILNLTPCVLPIIPIKIMGLTQTAGNPKRALLLGSTMAAGVVSFWVVIGVMIISLTGFNAISDIFRLPEFVLGIGLFIFAMGFGMLGVFTVQLPKAVYMINPNHESVGGAFFFGVMTAILSTPCTAPFMGAVTAWSTTVGNNAIVMTVFGAVGAGMASPYLVLSAYPKLVSKVPRTGPASELVKQTMGMLMIAVSFFFLGTGVLALGSKYPGLGLSLYWWVIVLIVAIAGAWLVMRTKSLTTRPGPVIGTAIGSLLVTGALAWWSVGQTNLARQAAMFALEERQEKIDRIRELEAALLSGGGDVAIAKRTWREYTPEDYDEAIRTGKTVLLEFDAVW